ncbi:hypothetical protein AWB81_03658 [Caballeronia arationis]|jgi:hypothetical protein|uniref:Polyketide cyclase / dehydrase and lipid transport n=2 Tax=Caballeronia arationis TaxID=1777142 RepID=A0A7Z7I9W0_9BURK|nr:hypothetical protein AWB81_03658 [Caballeronia arationis]SOE81622.1 hypothetical protein SAMN05446927_4911 [Caballeronia arationis]
MAVTDLFPNDIEVQACGRIRRASKLPQYPSASGRYSATSKAGRGGGGIERIEIHGPFVTGTTFSMKVPDADEFTSPLLEVHENAAFVDETILDGTRVVVLHEISPLSGSKSRVTYSAEITGPNEREFGPMVTGDFADVLKALKSLAEST